MDNTKELARQIYEMVDKGDYVKNDDIYDYFLDVVESLVIQSGKQFFKNMMEG